MPAVERPLTCLAVIIFLLPNAAQVAIVLECPLLEDSDHASLVEALSSFLVGVGSWISGKLVAMLADYPRDEMRRLVTVLQQVGFVEVLEGLGSQGGQGFCWMLAVEAVRVLLNSWEEADAKWAMPNGRCQMPVMPALPESRRRCGSKIVPRGLCSSSFLLMTDPSFVLPVTAANRSHAARDHSTSHLHRP
eukprot:357531-Chlamydomonas_euryale.AAC.3